jgi:hypothetical protein
MRTAESPNERLHGIVDAYECYTTVERPLQTYMLVGMSAPARELLMPTCPIGVTITGNAAWSKRRILKLY